MKTRRTDVLGYCLAAFCLFASTLLAQDPGLPDTVRIGTVSGDVYNDLSVQVTLHNDEALLSVLIPILIDGSSGWMRFDSISYTGGRLEDISVLPERESFAYVTDTFTYEAFVIRFSVSSGDPLPAGDGKLCDIWFSPAFGGEVQLDTITFSPYGNLKLSDNITNDFLPQFQSGAVDIACDYEIGDTRFDGGVNIGDWMGFWKQYFGCQEALSPPYIADVNCDRHVDGRDLWTLFRHVWYSGDICACGSYSPALYNDPGQPDTLWIENQTLFVGVQDTVDVRIIFDEPLSIWSVALHWDGSAILNLDHNFSYGGGYLCVNYDGNPGYVCPYVPQQTGLGFQPNDTIIARLPFTAENVGTATITMGDFPTGPGSMYVTALGEAVVPVVTGGQITVLLRPCGDANGDGLVNVGDAVYLINYVFREGPAPEPVCIADVDGDGETNVGDAVYLIVYIFKGGTPPVEDCCP